MQMAAVRQIFGLRAMKYRRGLIVFPGLPAAYDTGEEKGETLVITMRETASAVKVKLYYGVFEKENVITRTVCIAECRERKQSYLDKAAFLQCRFPLWKLGSYLF